MRQVVLLFVFVLLGFALPAAAQTVADPADFLPASVPLYLEIASDEASIQQFQSLFDAVMEMGNNNPFPVGTSIIDAALNPAVNVTLPEVDFERDIAPWLAGNRVGMAIYGNVTATASPSSPTEYVLVLPIADDAAAHAFVVTITGDEDLVTLQSGIIWHDLSPTVSLLIRENAIMLGTFAGTEQIANNLDVGRLADAEWYNNVKSQLPADPLISGYVNGEWVAAQVAQQEAMSPSDAPSAAVLFETVLRLHPAESAMEDAFLQFPPFVGAGFAMDYADGRLDITAAATVDATYPAPTLTTATAGAGLLDVIPADSILVFDTYDGAIPISGVVGLALLGPAIGSVFDNIIFQLENPGVPTPTPTPTPTPLPPPTADDLIAQAQPIIQQVEAALGISLEEVYTLINGEFAIAVFPSAVPPTNTGFGTVATPGFALYMQTSDAERLLQVIDKSTESLSLLMGSPFSAAPAIQFESDIVNGVEVTLVGTEGGVTRAVYGILDGDILFLTIEDYLETVLSAASDDTPITQTRAWHNDVYDGFGTGQEALFFMDISKYVSVTWSPYSTGTPPDVGQLLITTDFADDGRFPVTRGVAIGIIDLNPVPTEVGALREAPPQPTPHKHFIPLVTFGYPSPSYWRALLCASCCMIITVWKVTTPTASPLAACPSKPSCRG